MFRAEFFTISLQYVLRNSENVPCCRCKWTVYKFSFISSPLYKDSGEGGERIGNREMVSFWQPDLWFGGQETTKYKGRKEAASYKKKRETNKHKDNSFRVSPFSGEVNHTKVKVSAKSIQNIKNLLFLWKRRTGPIFT